MNYKDFAGKIKSKYPDYADMDDRDLAQKMVTKFPEYSDVTFDEPLPENKMDAIPYLQDMAPKVSSFRASPIPMNKELGYSFGEEKNMPVVTGSEATKTRTQRANIEPAADTPYNQMNQVKPEMPKSGFDSFLAGAANVTGGILGEATKPKTRTLETTNTDELARYKRGEAIRQRGIDSKDPQFFQKLSPKELNDYHFSREVTIPKQPVTGLPATEEQVYAARAHELQTEQKSKELTKGIFDAADQLASLEEQSNALRERILDQNIYNDMHGEAWNSGDIALSIDLLGAQAAARGDKKSAEIVQKLKKTFENRYAQNVPTERLKTEFEGAIQKLRNYTDLKTEFDKQVKNLSNIQSLQATTEQQVQALPEVQSVIASYQDSATEDMTPAQVTALSNDLTRAIEQLPSVKKLYENMNNQVASLAEVKQLHTTFMNQVNGLPEVQVMSKNLNADIEDLNPRNKNWFTKLTTSTVEMLPPLLKGAALSTVPIVGGAAAGTMWAAQGAGSTFNNLIEDGVDPQKARQAAAVVGPIYAAIEMVQLGQLTRVPALKDALQKGFTNAIKQLGKEYGYDLIKEVNEEGLQGIVQTVGEEVTKGTSPKEVAKLAVKSYIENVKQSIGPMAIIGAPAKIGSGVKAVAEQNAAKYEETIKPDIQANVQPNVQANTQANTQAKGEANTQAKDKVLADFDIKDEEFWTSDKRDEVFKQLQPEEQHRLINLEEKKPEIESLKKTIVDFDKMTDEEKQTALAQEEAKTEKAPETTKPVPMDETQRAILEHNRSADIQKEMLNVNTEPSDAQKVAGNYPKGHIERDGLKISIENPAGSTRNGVDEYGRTWSRQINQDYGYIRGTQGKDKDPLDVFIQPETHGQEDKNVFIVNQINPETGKFDEHKIMMGFDNAEAAKQAYLSNYEPGWTGLKSVVEMPIDVFKEWIKTDATKNEAIPLSIEEINKLPKRSTSYGMQGQAKTETVLIPETGNALPVSSNALPYTPKIDVATAARILKGRVNLPGKENELAADLMDAITARDPETLEDILTAKGNTTAVRAVFQAATGISIPSEIAEARVVIQRFVGDELYRDFTRDKIKRRLEPKVDKPADISYTSKETTKEEEQDGQKLVGKTDRPVSGKSGPSSTAGTAGQTEKVSAIAGPSGKTDTQGNGEVSPDTQQTQKRSGEIVEGSDSDSTPEKVKKPRKPPSDRKYAKVEKNLSKEQYTLEYLQEEFLHELQVAAYNALRRGWRHGGKLFQGGYIGWKRDFNILTDAPAPEAMKKGSLSPTAISWLQTIVNNYLDKKAAQSLIDIGLEVPEHVNDVSNWLERSKGLNEFIRYHDQFENVPVVDDAALEAAQRQFDEDHTKLTPEQREMLEEAWQANIEDVLALKEDETEPKFFQESKPEQTINSVIERSSGVKNALTIVTRPPTDDHTLAEKVAQAFGVNVAWFKQNDEFRNKMGGIGGIFLSRNSKFENTLFINERTKTPVINTIGHELLHRMRQKHPDLYEYLKDAILSEASEEYFTSLAAYTNAYGTTIDVTHEELIAEFTGEEFSKRTFWDKLYDQSPDTFKAAMKILHDLISKTLNVLRTGNNQALVKDVQKVRDVLVQVTREYQKREQNTAVTVIDSAFSLTPEDLNYTEEDVKAKYNSMKLVNKTNDSVQLTLDLFDQGTQLDLFYDAAPIVKQENPKWYEKYGKLDNLYAGETRVKHNWQKHHFINLNGVEAASPDEIAKLFSVYRHPNMEHVIFVYLDKNNKIVGHNALCTGLANASRGIELKEDDDTSFERFEDRMKRLGATGYYMIHNHPGGSMKSSAADRSLTTKYANNVVYSKLLGHIILDHDSYVLLTPVNAGISNSIYMSEKVVSLKNDFENFNEDLKNASLIASQHDVGRIGKQVINGSLKSAVIVLNNQNMILAWYPITNFNAINAQNFHQIVRNAGGTFGVFVSDSKTEYKQAVQVVKDNRGQKFDAILDVVNIQIANGNSTYESAVEKRIIDTNVSGYREYRFKHLKSGFLFQRYRDENQLDLFSQEKTKQPEVKPIPVKPFTEALNQIDLFSQLPEMSTQIPEPKQAISDFGEKIGGAKKDYFAKLSESENFDIASNPFSKVWPEPDYDNLIAAGVDPFLVAFAHAARDEVPTKPQKSWKLNQWIEQVVTLRTLSKKWLSGNDVSKENVSKILEVMGIKNVAGRAELYERFGHNNSFKGISLFRHHFSLYHGEKDVTKWLIEKKAAASAFSNWPTELAAGNTKEEALENFSKRLESLNSAPKERKTQFDIYSYKKDPTVFWIGKKTATGYVNLFSFQNSKEAREFLREEYDQVLARFESFKKIGNERREKNNPRVGTDYRKGKDVTPEMFSDAFGFRGVEFGNWVEQGKRQDDLNKAYDSLMDLAVILNIPSKAISLNGKLGLAFGARGYGGKRPAKAHYEPDYIVINLTKESGAGSLAHEWWHAFDHYMNKYKPINATELPVVKTASYGPRFVNNSNMRDEMVTAFGQLIRAIDATKLPKRSEELDTRRSKAYWSTIVEMSARSFENYIIERLSVQKMTNDYLANIAGAAQWAQDMIDSFMGGKTAMDSYPYLTEDEMAPVVDAYNAIFNALRTEKTPEGTIAMFQREDQADLFGGADLSGEPVLDLFGQQEQLFGKPKEQKKEEQKKPEQKKPVYETGDLFAGTTFADTRSKTRQLIDAELQRREQEKLLKQKNNILEGTPLFDKNEQEARATKQETLPLFQREPKPEYPDLFENMDKYGWDKAHEINAQWEKDFDVWAEKQKLPAVFTSKDGSLYYLITPNISEKYPYRVTTFTKSDTGEMIPLGHSERETKLAAFDEVKYNNYDDQESIRFQREKVDPFYSPLLKAVQGLKQEKGTGEQFFAMITKAPGVKEAEWKWIGLDDFLKGKKSVTKQEIVDFVNENQVVIKEEIYGKTKLNVEKIREIIEAEIHDETHNPSNIWEDRIRKIRSDEIAKIRESVEVINGRIVMDYGNTRRSFSGDDVYSVEDYEIQNAFDLNDFDMFDFITEEEKEERYQELMTNGEVEDRLAYRERYYRDNDIGNYDTKYEDYTLEDGDNYRELLLVLPSTKPDPEGLKKRKEIFAKWQPLIDQFSISLDNLLTNPELKLDPELKAIYIDGVRENLRNTEEKRDLEADAAYKLGNNISYKSGHWEPENVFAHTRIDDRKYNAEKVLFVEEIQSDWEREARQKGVTGQGRTITPNDIEVKFFKSEVPEGANPENYPGYWESYDRVTGQMITRHAGRTTEQNVKNEALEMWLHTYQLKSVPNQPFLKNWQEVVLKRVLRMAAEEGYDRIAWVTGKQTADRYNLAKYIESIGYQKRGENNYNIAVYGSASNAIWRNDHATLEDIEAQAGKDIAKRIRDGVGDKEGNITYLKDVNLTMGGEWAVNLYDKLIPQFLEKYGKKWGTKVEPIDLSNGENANNNYHRQVGTQKSIPITDEMKESVLKEGQPLFQREKVDPFYSPLLKAVQGLKQEKGTGEQFFAMITKAPGVKEAEWKWIGLDDFLKAKKSVTKQEIVDFVNENQVNPKETILTKEGFNEDWARAKAEEEIKEDINDINYANGEYWYYSMEQIKKDILNKIKPTKKEIDDYITMEYNGEIHEFYTRWAVPEDDDILVSFDITDDKIFDMIPEAEKESAYLDALRNGYLDNRIDEMREEFNSSEHLDEDRTKYQQYTLKGSENYREVLFTLPVKENSDGLRKRAEIFNKYKERLDELYNQLDTISEADENRVNINLAIDSLQEERDVEANKAYQLIGDRNNYQSSHWDEKNVFAHTRLDDRTWGGEKVLFIEEIQSDWEREARKKGVQGDRFLDEYTAKNVGGKYWDIFKEDVRVMGLQAESEGEALSIANRELGNNRVPNQPFLKNWHEVVLKRVLRMAAEEGYDRIAWVTGKQTADRYNLAKYIDKIVYQKLGDNLYHISVFDKNGRSVLVKQDATEEYIADTLGKDIAQKIKDGVGRKGRDVTFLENLDLKMGGEWAVNLYDKLIPQFLEKYGKKWNVKVEPIDMTPRGSDTKSWTEVETDSSESEAGIQKSIPITDEMKESVLKEGQPLFQQNGYDWYEQDSRNPEQQHADLQEMLTKSDWTQAEKLYAELNAIKKWAQDRLSDDDLLTTWNTKLTPFEKKRIDEIKQILNEMDIDEDNDNIPSILKQSFQKDLFETLKDTSDVFKDWSSISKEKQNLIDLVGNSLQNNYDKNEVENIISDIERPNINEIEILNKPTVILAYSPSNFGILPDKYKFNSGNWFTINKKSFNDDFPYVIKYNNPLYIDTKFSTDIIMHLIQNPQRYSDFEGWLKGGAKRVEAIYDSYYKHTLNPTEMSVEEAESRSGSVEETEEILNRDKQLKSQYVNPNMMFLLTLSQEFGNGIIIDRIRELGYDAIIYQGKYNTYISPIKDLFGNNNIANLYGDWKKEVPFVKDRLVVYNDSVDTYEYEETKTEYKKKYTISDVDRIERRSWYKTYNGNSPVLESIGEFPDIIIWLKDGNYFIHKGQYGPVDNIDALINNQLSQRNALIPGVSKIGYNYTVDKNKSNIAKYVDGVNRKNVLKNIQHDNSNLLFQRMKKKSPLAPFEKLQEASAKVEERIRSSRQYQSEINRLRYQLRKLPEDALDKRALIEVKIDKATDKRVDEIKQGIYEYASKIGLRGVPYNKVDLLLKNAKTIKGLQKALNTMDAVYDRTRIAELQQEVYKNIFRIQKKLNRLQNAKVPSNIDIEGNRALRDYLDKLMFNVDTIDKERAKKLLTWLQRDAAGSLKDKEMEEIPKSLVDWLNDMSLPIPSIAEDAIKGLFSKSIDRMTANELQDVLDEIKSIETTGKERRKVESEQRVANEIIAVDAMSSEIIRKRKPSREKPIRGETLEERAKRSRTLWNTIKQLPWQARDIDRIIVALTGKTSGTALEKYILKPMAKANTLYKVGMKAVDTFVKKTYENLSIPELRKPWIEIYTNYVQPGTGEVTRETRTLTQEEGMFIYANSKNEAQAEHLYATLNHTDRSDAIRVMNEVVSKLPENLKAAVEAQWEYFDKVQWARMNEVFSKAHNIDMGHEQWYMPATNLDRKGEGINIDADLMMRAASQASSDIGSTKGRIVMGPDPRVIVDPNQGPVAVKASPYKDMLYFTAIVPAMRHAEHYIAFYETVFQTNRYLNKPEFVNALDAHDPAVAPVLMDWLKAMAYGKWSYGQGQEYYDSIIRYLRGAAGRYQILGRLTSLLLQASSAPRGFVATNPKYAFSSLSNMIKNPAKYFDIINSKSAEIEGRMKDWDQTISEWAESEEAKKLLGKWNPIDKIGGVLGNIIGGYDKFWASYIWFAKYSESLDKKLSEEDAIYEADKVIRKTQSGGGILASNRLQRGGDMYRAFTQFLSDAVKAYNMLDETVMAWKNLPPTQKASYIVLGLLLPAFMTHLVRSGGDPTKDPLNYAKELIGQVTGAIPFVGSVIDYGTMLGINTVKEKVLGVKPNKNDLNFISSVTPPALAVFEDVGKELSQATNAKTPDKFAYHLFNAIAQSIGLPGGGQIKRTWGGMEEAEKTGDYKHLVLPKSAVQKPKHVMIGVINKTGRTWKEENAFINYYNSLSPDAKSSFIQRSMDELQLTMPEVMEKIDNVQESFYMQDKKFDTKMKSLDRKLADGEITQQEYDEKYKTLEQDRQQYEETLQK